MNSLHDKVAVITGAGAGIGEALALALAARGCHLALSDIDPAAAETVAGHCRLRGVKAVAYGVDVADRAAMTTFAADVMADFGRVNLVINNAGVYLVSQARDMRWESFDWLMGINFWGVMHGSQLFLPHLIASGDGHLVNISSMAGLVSFPYSSAYNAAKFAVRGYTESVAQEMRMDNLPVQVTCVHPGCIKTGIFRHSRGDSPEQQRDAQSFFEAMARTSPEQAAQQIVAGILANRSRILIGADARLLHAAQQLSGTGYQRLNQFSLRLFNLVGNP